ncbi:polyamine ABC transporter substrate-binding protein [Marinobacterium mangrovicola]|uniref:Putrescine-binding periplasmic protein n=1 Tax=Marinobacterium mangrovicola TaxID=1476959 RepID=A0A4R1GKH7_9GAMM|nr:polyamine ABC transporter substrate-binding protein [Marinobacterium mangrovicola]TCK07425.1 putrescine transport system substrate-binding protein [Marinobacterium mangrovicola]
MISAFKRTLLATSVALTVSSTAMAEERTLHIYNWSDYIAQDTIEEFEKETGINVVYDVFDSNKLLEAKLLSGNSGYDIVVPSNIFITKEIKAGIFEELDKDKLPNWKNLNPTLLKSLDGVDPGNKHAFPYLWGTTGIGYNVDKIKEVLGVDEITSWSAVFEPENMEKLQECGVSMLDSVVEIYPAVLNYLGENPYPTDTAGIDKAEAALSAVRPYVQYFHSSKYISDLANGNTCVAVGWSGDIIQAQSRANEAGAGINIEYAIPEEGALTFFDMMGMPKDAKNKEEAYEFMNYILRGDVIANITNYVAYANPNDAATPMVEEELRNNPGIYPTEETKENLYTYVDLNHKVLRAMNRSWTRITAGQ